MTISIKEAKRYEDLMSLESHDMPYCFDKIFSTEGWGAKSLSKKKFKLLKNIDSQIRAMLNENEKVHFISWGVQSSALESSFIEWSYYISRVAFVFTNQRIIFLRISSRNKPLELRYQIRYPVITKIGSRFWSLRMEFQSRKKMIFSHVPGRDRKIMPKLIDDFRSTISTPEEKLIEKENLCPHCYVVVEEFPQSCPHCMKAFKSANTAGWLSLLFPGFGDFYLGHRTFAILEILSASVIWVSVLFSGGGFIWALFIFIFMHGIDALVTRYVGRKGLYPSGI